MEKELINKKTTKKQWKKFLKTEEFVDHFAFYRAIQMSAKSMIAQMIDFLFMDEIYIAFLELLELNNNIDIMLKSKSYEVQSLCKERIDFFLREKAENWYL